MKVLITGATGQLGYELMKTVPPGVQAVGLGRSDLDLRSKKAIARAIEAHQPGAVINSAAYTQVDAAENDRERAFAVNAEAAGKLAAATTAQKARLIHVSTDFVFGEPHGLPWLPDDKTSPLSVYGESKLEGEKRVDAATGGRALIVRTAWLYSHQGKNFVTSILSRIRAAQPLRVVEDQIGTPTWARGLARALWAALENEAIRGIHHWTDAGAASWYDFAVAIQEEALGLGLLENAVAIHPVSSAVYPTAAQRPSFSVLDKTATWKALGLEPVHWRVALRQMLQDMKLRDDA